MDNYAPLPTHRPAFIGSADIVRVVLGGILLLAAALKTHQLSTEPVNNCATWRCRLLPTLEIQVELALGLWLVSGLFEQAARVMAGVCFGAFAVVSGYKGFLGDYSCGCFGKLVVGPWHSMSLDIAAVAALLVFRRSAVPPGPARPLRLAVVVALFAASAASAAVSIARYEPTRLMDDGRLSGPGRAVLLEPDRWAGKPWPLLSHVDVADKLREGRWTVILYRWHCRPCQRHIAQRDAEARRLAERGGVVRVALVELPPYAPAGKDPVPSDTRLLRGRLSAGRLWFVHTPTVVELRDGEATQGP